MDISQYEHYVLLALGALSAAVPFARWVAAQTASKTDDAAVEKVATMIHDLLGYIPQIEFAKSISLADKDKLSK